LIFKEP